ncbi:MAG: hypothetical protein C0478_18325 [Planctomyces sp.]|nr:hypothetical protein [Planctomyces sp.]
MDQETSKMPVSHQVIIVYSAIALWEYVNIPYVSSMSHWNGLYLSLMGLSAGAWWIGTRFQPTSWAFVFGLGGSLLFVPRFIDMRLPRYGAIELSHGTTIITFLWVLFAMILGIACWVTALIVKGVVKD